MFTLFSHGPAAGAPRRHDSYDTVQKAEAFLAQHPDFQEGSQLYLVDGENRRIWMDEPANEMGIQFSDITDELGGREQMMLCLGEQF